MRGPRLIAIAPGTSRMALASAGVKPPSGPVRIVPGPGLNRLAAGFVGKVQRAPRVVRAQECLQPDRRIDCGEAGAPALLGRLDDVRRHPLEVQLVDDRPLRDDRLKPNDPQLDGFLHQPVDPPLLDRSERQREVGNDLLRSHRLDDGQCHALLASLGELGQPLPGNAVEQQQRVARHHPHDRGQIMCLAAFEADRGAGGQGLGNEQALQRAGRPGGGGDHRGTLSKRRDDA
jgi:hypothetical protein